MEAKFGDLRGVVSLLASMHPAWQSATMAAPLEALRQEEAQREEDAEPAEIDLNSRSLFQAAVDRFNNP